MACFTVPASAAVLTTLFRKRIPKRLHIGWLNAMTWGGAAALAVEHVAHGEIVPWPPFLTAMASPAETTVMLHEMAAVGIPMTLALVATWLVMVGVAATWPALRPGALWRRYRLGLLGLLLLGTGVMVAVDRLIAFQGLSHAAPGILANGLVLGAAMLLPVVAIWGAAVALRGRADLCRIART